MKDEPGRAEEAERDAERAERRARRLHRHEERRERHQSFDLGSLVDLTGEEFTEDVEGVFRVDGPARLRTRNVSGVTRVVVGTDGTVRVQARKRVRGSSAEKAKRLLQNVEVRMEQEGSLIDVKPHLYEQDRGWLDLFRGGRISVDLVITVPRESSVEAHTVSGDLGVTGIRGKVEAQSVSGDLTVDDVQGPLWLKSVSGDCTCIGFVGQLESNTVSGDLSVERCRLRQAEIVTVSGDLSVDGDLDAGGEHRIRTISGDIDLALAGHAYAIAYKTMSGDVSLDAEGHISKDGRRDCTIVIGAQHEAARLNVKTVSGDLTVRTSGSLMPEDASPRSAAAVAPKREEARDVLERLARGELDVDAAAAALDAARGR